jgi:hypothetical protein
MATTDRPARSDRDKLASSARMLTLALGIVFLAVGVVGFFITGFDNVAGQTDEHLLFFEINPLHNAVHLLLGIVGLALFRTTRGALLYGYITAIGYGGAFLYGLFAMDKSWDVLSINTADNILHLALAAVGIVLVGLGHAALSAAPARSGSRTGFRAPGGGAAPA